MSMTFLSIKQWLSHYDRSITSFQIAAWKREFFAAIFIAVTGKATLHIQHKMELNRIDANSEDL